MQPRELPQLITGDTPVFDVEPLRGATRKRSGWLAASVLALLLGGGVTATLLGGTPEPAPRPAAAAEPEAPRPRATGATAERESSAKPTQDRARPPRDDEGFPLPTL